MCVLFVVTGREPGTDAYDLYAWQPAAAEITTKSAFGSDGAWRHVPDQSLESVATEASLTIHVPETFNKSDDSLAPFQVRAEVSMYSSLRSK